MISKNSFLMMRWVCMILLFFPLLSTTVHANESRLMEAPVVIDDQPITTRYIMR
jgi:hypothetical protein